MSTLNCNPIFVVGAPRSGTTLLQYMLRSHPNISLPTAESHFFIPLINKESDFADLNQKCNIINVLSDIYRRSPSFIDTDLHGMKFNIDTLADEFHGEGRNKIESIIEGIFEKNACGEGKNDGAIKHLLCSTYENTS